MQIHISYVEDLSQVAFREWMKHDYGVSLRRKRRKAERVSRGKCIHLADAASDAASAAWYVSQQPPQVTLRFTMQSNFPHFHFQCRLSLISHFIAGCCCCC